MKNEVFRFWIQKVSQNIWLHHHNSKELKQKFVIFFLLNIIILPVFFFSFKKNNFLEFICLLTLFIANDIIILFFLKKVIKHDIAKNRYNIFLEEINQELYLSSEDILSFLLYKKLELDKLIKTSPRLSQSVLEKYKKKFNKNTLISDFSKIPPKYNLYSKMILIRYFNIWKSHLKKQQCNAYYLGPFYGNRKFFFEFQNVKLGNNDIEISIE